ncbi:MAG: hypothetical protein CMH27_05480 [Micavibrio sp.]|nr:hypothetical protein [Micavibrio sp.]|tara:strand:- start:901 stop:2649 length:1749 start_codon:yes stop_codon:yes gene_type:complete
MHEFALLTPTVLLLSVGFMVILICRLTRVSPIIGFLLAGLVLGPHGMGLIHDTETTHLLAELGVVFLLFDIGLHFSTKSAWSMRRDLFGLAPMQMLITGVILASTMKFIFGMSGDFALLTGFALALSSTAVVMQIIGDLRQNESPVGKSAKAMLIFQDTLAIFLLIFADTVGSNETELAHLVLTTLLKTIIAIILVVALGKYVLTPLLRLVTRYNDPEMFTVLGLVIVMVTAAMTDYAGLSLTLGAFLAGMVLAETPFRILLQNELRPFRSLLMAFFFISTGMMLEPAIIIANGDVVLSLLLLILSVKAAVIGALIFISRRPAHHAIQLAFFLAQGSEFAFVIFSMAAVSAGMGSAISQQLISAVALSMLVTPIFSGIAYRWSLNICQSLKGITNVSIYDNSPVNKQPVFIVGMNEVGKTLARAFREHNISYIAIEHDRNRFLEATAAGYVVAYGNPGDLRFWNTLGADNARAVCVASPRYEITKEISPVIQKLYPRLKRYVAVNDSDEAQRFMALGTIPFHNKGAPPGLEMACFLLSEFGVSHSAIEDFQEEEHGAYLEIHPDPVLDERYEEQGEELPVNN